MKAMLLAAALVVLAAGCAMPEASTEQSAREPEYRTGSNIPRKSKEGVDRESGSKAERAPSHVANPPVVQTR